MNQPVTEREIIRFLTGECSQKEQERVQAWRTESPRNRALFNEYHKTWELSGNLEAGRGEDEAWERLSQRMSTPGHLTIHHLNREMDPGHGSQQESQASRSKSSFSPDGRRGFSPAWMARAAAVLLLLIGVSFVVYNAGEVREKRAGQPEIKHVVAERGERMSVTLADGSSVVLNASSELRFPSRFDGPSREIVLKGEAFFSVARNENKPFIVHTGGTTIRVLGTKFNVNAYSDFNRVEVVVADGRVAVRSDSQGTAGTAAAKKLQGREVVLEKGEYTMVRQGDLPSPPVKTALENHMGWMNGNLIFDAAPLNIVLKRLELYYNRDFEVSDSSLYDRKLTATFKKESLTKVLDVLSVALDVEYEQTDSLIYLKPPK